MKKFLVVNLVIGILLPILYFFVISPVFAIQVKSNCVLTNIGNPPANYPLPSHCTETTINCTGAKCAFDFIVHPNTLCQHYTGLFPPLHEGVDLCATANTPIHALETGIAIESYFDTGCGNIVKLYDPKQKRYMLHCHMIKPGIAKNTPVKRGDVIGYVGHTGANTSPTDHVHFQITAPTNDQYANGINPETVLVNWPNY